MNTYNINELKRIRDLILSLHENEQVEIIKIIKNNNFKYTQNNNGVFINMNKLSDEILEKIDKFLEYSKLNNKLLEDSNIVRNNIVNN
jgi:hypothetical protein